MMDAAKSQTLNDAKDRLEASLERINTLVTQKNTAVMEAQAILDERAHLRMRVVQLEALNAEHDVDVAHQALRTSDHVLDKKAILKLRDEYEKLRTSQDELELELLETKKLLAANSAARENSDADEALKIENVSLREELSKKVRQVNALESEAVTSDTLRHETRDQLDSLIKRVEIMVEQANV
jgi:hypothetical protein